MSFLYTDPPYVFPADEWLDYEEELPEITEADERLYEFESQLDAEWEQVRDY